MPLFDKVKAQAAQVAQKAQEAGRAGAAKLEDVQTKRQFDALLQDLGAAVYAGRSSAGDQPEVVALVKKLEQFEAEHGRMSDGDTVNQTSPDAPPPESPGAEPANFTL